MVKPPGFGLASGMGSRLDALYDRLEAAWNRHGTQRRVADLLVLAFLLALGLIELNRRGLLPASLSPHLPRQHFQAVSFVFTCLLFFELTGLLFSLAASTADSVGKQIELFSIILLRHSFNEFGDLDEPLRWQQLSPTVPRILGDGLGALLIFAVLVAYYRVQEHRPITSDAGERGLFIGAKKRLSLALLVAFAGLAWQAAWKLGTGGGANFFDTFFTLLIFSDILLVLVALRYTSGYRMVFRNSGFALVTVVLRLALTAPPLLSAALGIGAALYAVGLTVAFNAHLRRSEAA